MDDRIFNTFGGRLFSCRMQTRKSKLYYQKKYKIDRQIFTRYELSDEPSVRDDLILKIFNALKSEGILDLNLDWLLFGKGKEPYLPSIDKIENNTIDIDPINAIKDISIFERRYKNFVKLLISDDSLKPYLNIGDWIGGISHDAINILQMKEQIAIIIEKKSSIKKVGIVTLLSNGYFKIYKCNMKKYEKIKKSDINFIVPIIFIRKSKSFRSSKT